MAERPASSPILKRLLDPRVLLTAALLVFSSAIFIYSQTMAFVWDEGFHLIAAQLIDWGKSPYIDFAFPQTLLNAYFNAAVLRIAGNSWKAVHAFDALFVAATVWMTARYVMRRFPEERWRLTCALAAACLLGFNGVTFAFGPISQAYGSGTMLAFGAYIAAVRSVERQSALLFFLSALLAGAAAGSTLLTAPILPVLFIWLMLKFRAQRVLPKIILFCLGVAIPFAPEIWLFIRAPKQTFFNVVQYQALFRRVNWGDVNGHDFDVFTDWTTSVPAFLLGLLFVIGLIFIVRRSGWERTVRGEFYLAAAMALALGIYIATAHPTFGRYFIFMIPFTAVVASAGFYYVGARLIGADRPRWPLALLLFTLLPSAAKYVFDDREATNWHDYEKIAAKIHQVTPPHAEYFADELVYFLLRQAPPSGMEFSYSHKIQLPPSQEKLYHVISLAELKDQVAKGRFATFETCKDEIIDDFELSKYFPHKEDFDDCTVFWRNGK